MKQTEDVNEITDNNGTIIRELRKIRFDNTVNLGSVLTSSGLRTGDFVSVTTKPNSGMITIWRIQDQPRKNAEEVRR